MVFGYKSDANCKYDVSRQSGLVVVEALGAELDGLGGHVIFQEDRLGVGEGRSGLGGGLQVALGVLLAADSIRWDGWVFFTPE